MGVTNTIVSHFYLKNRVCPKHKLYMHNKHWMKIYWNVNRFKSMGGNFFFLFFVSSKFSAVAYVDLII